MTKSEEMKNLTMGLFKLVDDYFIRKDAGASEKELDMYMMMLRNQRDTMKKRMAAKDNIVNFPKRQ